MNLNQTNSLLLEKINQSKLDFNEQYPTLMTMMFKKIQKHLIQEQANWGLDEDTYLSLIENKSYERAYLFFYLLLENREILKNFKQLDTMSLYVLDNGKEYMKKRREIAMNKMSLKEEYEKFGNENHIFSFYYDEKYQGNILNLTLSNYFSSIMNYDKDIETVHDLYDFINHLFKEVVKDEELLENKMSQIGVAMPKYIKNMQLKITDDVIGNKLNDTLQFFMNFTSFTDEENQVFKIMVNDFNHHFNLNGKYDYAHQLFLSAYILERLSPSYYEEREKLFLDSLLFTVKYLDDSYHQDEEKEFEANKILKDFLNHFRSNKKLTDLSGGEEIIKNVNHFKTLAKEIDCHFNSVFNYFSLSEEELKMFSEIKKELKEELPILFDDDVISHLKNKDNISTVVCASHFSYCLDGAFIYEDNVNKMGDDKKLDYVQYMNSDLMTPIIHIDKNMDKSNIKRSDYINMNKRLFAYSCIVSSQSEYKNHLETTVGVVVKSHGLNMYRLTASLTGGFDSNFSAQKVCFLNVRESCSNMLISGKSLGFSQVAYDTLGQFAKDNQLILYRDFRKMTEEGKKYLMNKFAKIKKNNPDVLCLEFGERVKILDRVSNFKKENIKKQYLSLGSQEEKQQFLLNLIVRQLEKREKETLSCYYDWLFYRAIEAHFYHNRNKNKPTATEYQNWVQIYRQGYDDFRQKIHAKIAETDLCKMYEKAQERDGLGFKKDDVKIFNQKMLDTDFSNPIIDELKRELDKKVDVSKNVKMKFS